MQASEAASNMASDMSSELASNVVSNARSTATLDSATALPSLKSVRCSMHTRWACVTPNARRPCLRMPVAVFSHARLSSCNEISMAVPMRLPAHSHTAEMFPLML